VKKKEKEMASINTILVDFFGWLCFVLTFLVLMPQAYQNFRLQSTQGLSVLMMQLFLFGSIAPFIYDLYQSQPISIVLSWIGFSVVDIFILCQCTYYEGHQRKDKAEVEERIRQRNDDLELDRGEGKNDLTSFSSATIESKLSSLSSLQERRKKFVLNYLLYCAACTTIMVALYFIFVAADAGNAHIVVVLIGYIVPVILIILGYLVQIRLIVAGKDSQGVAPLFILIDIVSCSSSITSISLNAFDGAACAPFFIIIACQLIMGLLYYVIYPAKKPTESPKPPESLKGEEKRVDIVIQLQPRAKTESPSHLNGLASRSSVELSNTTNDRPTSNGHSHSHSHSHSVPLP